MSADIQMRHRRAERCDTVRVAARWRGRWTADSASEQRHLLELFGGGVGEGLPLGAAIRAGLTGRLSPSREIENCLYLSASRCLLRFLLKGSCDIRG